MRPPYPDLPYWSPFRATNVLKDRDKSRRASVIRVYALMDTCLSSTKRKALSFFSSLEDSFKKARNKNQSRLVIDDWIMTGCRGVLDRSVFDVEVCIRVGFGFGVWLG